MGRVRNNNGKTRYHDHLLISEIIESFGEHADIIDREIKRLNRELKVYKKMFNFVDDQLMPYEDKMFWNKVIKELYMKNDKRFKRLDNLKAMKQLMRNEGNSNGYSVDQIDEARNVPIETLYDFQKKKKTRSGFTACCPFHGENNPSFSVRRNKYMCFSCLRQGSGAIDFLIELEGLKFIDAVRRLT